ncbi:MAG: hypothetical protein DMG06_24210 [Acidobacteria bacterium]|nr:MAG: hypothetical protein DMG06_24210 [Acidobacteriota bacterium]
MNGEVFDSINLMNLRKGESSGSPPSNGGSAFSAHLCLIPILSLLSFLLPPLLKAQDQTNPSKNDFKLLVDVNLVGVLVTVTTPEGTTVSTLKQQDFQVYEDGNPQEVALFGKESDQPLWLCLLFDSSISIVSELRTEQDAAIEFLQSILRPADRASIFQVSEDVNELVKFTSRLEKICSAIRSITPPYMTLFSWPRRACPAPADEKLSWLSLTAPIPPVKFN